jgi:hypothetical protein
MAYHRAFDQAPVANEICRSSVWKPPEQGKGPASTGVSGK